jgi:nucleoside-diphosphate-sugar epimerase
MRQTVLITGADGLIGSHLSEALAGSYDLRLLAGHPIPGKESIVADTTKMR